MNLGCLHVNAGGVHALLATPGATNSERPSRTKPVGVYNEEERPLSSITVAPASVYLGVWPMA
jgi:hypothetical protein